MRLNVKLAIAMSTMLTLLPALAPSVSAAEAIDGADTTWVMVSIGLVLLMTPAVALFYGGLLRKESVLSMMGQSMLVMSLATLIWVVIGYSLAFGTDTLGIIGSLDHLFLEGVGLGPQEGLAIPELGFMMFQCTFVIITCALILGGVAERIRLKALMVFLTIWVMVVYSPVAHWVWGGGWIGELGALDFAGGTVVHIASGVSALAVVLVIGPRSGFVKKDHPHNLPLVFLGGALLWFGWFGFNGGSALAADAIAVNAIVVTHISAAAAAGTWAVINWLHLGRPGMIGIVSGAVAGLVAITPAAGYVNASGALAIGIGAGLFCYLGVMIKRKIRADDALDVFGIHGVGGIWGALATGIFATTTVNANGADGLLYGGTDLIVAQVISVGAVFLFAFTASFIIMKGISYVTEVRLTKEQERVGPDLIEHGERAYMD